MKPRVPSLITALCSPPSLATPIGDDQYDPPQNAQDQATQPNRKPDFIDGSGPIFSMYLEIAEKEDEKMAESWKADADGILVFVRFCHLVPYFQLTYLSVRLVYIPLLSPLCSRCRSRICNRTRRTRPTSTLPTYTSFLPTRINPTFPLPSLLPHLRFLHRALQFG